MDVAELGKDKVQVTLTREQAANLMAIFGEALRGDIERAVRASKARLPELYAEANE